MHKLARSVLIAVIAALGIGLTFPQNASDFFQKALTKEKAEGNLEEAIALFQQVVDRGGDESLAAQAQLHIGMCYEKLGLGKARESFQKVIDRYPRQTDTVKAARERLSILAARPEKIGGSRELNIRRVYDGAGPEWGNALSSDGRYLVYTDWDTGDMAVVDLKTKRHRRLTNTGGLRQPMGDMGETSVFSPDDRRIAYGWIVGQKTCELRAVNFDGSDPRLLFRDEEAAWIRPHSWSRDGKQILILIMRKDGSSDIALFYLSDSKVSLVRHLSAKDPKLDLSPDGKMIAYSMSPESSSSKCDIFIMKADGSGHEAIISQPSDDYLLGWAPDGRRVIFASDRLGSYGIWSINVVDGRAEGSPQWIKGELKPDAIRLTPDGTLYYVLFQSLSDVFTAPIDPDTGKALGNPNPIKSRYPGIRISPDWSPDGAQIVFKTRSSSGQSSSGPAGLTILNLKSGEERQFSPGLNSLDFMEGPRWAPDGRSVLFIGSRGQKLGIYQIEIPGGEMKLLVDIPAYQFVFRASWSRNGKSLFYAQGMPVRILRRDLESGRDVELATMKGPIGMPRIAPSPDGKWLAFTALDVMKEPVKLLLISVAGGPSKEIYRTSEGEYIQWLEWTPDGRSIWLMKYRQAVDPKMKPFYEFMSLSPDGKDVRKLELSNMGRIHPEGRQIVYHSGQVKAELWALENFLPPIQK
jgi:Tol biopolymer transport system component